MNIEEIENKIRRLKDEADRLDVVQASLKVLANSLYGAVGNQHFQFYRVQNAEAITKGGHAIITITEATANKWLNEYCGTESKDRILAIDTDSLLCDFSDIVSRECEGMTEEEITNHLDGIANELNKNIKAVFDDFVKRWNCPKNMISFKREKIARSGFWVAKKRYALHVIDNEGVRYAKPKTKITGLESVRSSTPPYYRKKIKEAIEKILSGTNKGIIEFIREQEEHMHDIPIEEISYPRGVSDMEKYIQPNGKLVESSVPIGVRAAYQFNKMCKRYDHKSEAPIKSGDKFRFCYLKMPNPSHENVIGFREKIPESFGLHDFIDVWEQFEKGFMSPLKKMLDAIGWTDGKITSIF